MVLTKTKKLSQVSRESPNLVFVYMQAKMNCRRVLGGLGIAILSTNQGVITDKEARKLQVGGEVSGIRLVGIEHLAKTSVSVV